MRYLEIWVAHVRPGHHKEWEELNKLFHSGSEKAVPTAHWAVYQAAYGAPDGTYIFLTARKTAGELDRGPQEDKAFEAALGEDGVALGHTPEPMSALVDRGPAVPTGAGASG